MICGLVPVGSVLPELPAEFGGNLALVAAA